MKLGIISDTHDNIKNFLKAIEIFNKNKVEYVIHCGDWVSPFMLDVCDNLKCDILSVFGNNEGDIFRLLTKTSKAKFFNKSFVKTFDNKKIAVYHGDSKPLLAGLIDSQKYDVVLSGHTHISVIETIGKTLHINPGTCSDYANSKIEDKPSIAIYDTKSNKAEIIFMHKNV
jgi:putative phosphoesterase